MSVTRTMVCRYFIALLVRNLNSCAQLLAACAAVSASGIGNRRHRAGLHPLGLAVPDVAQITIVEHRAVAHPDADPAMHHRLLQAWPARILRGLRPGKRA